MTTTDTVDDVEDPKLTQRLFGVGPSDVWHTVIKVVGLMAAIYALETWSYFAVAEYFGGLWGLDQTHNFQTAIDRVTPWCTPLYAIYIPWPFLWYFAIPLVILGATGKRGYSRYTVNAMLMYVIGSVIYALFPTTTTPADFINGRFDTLPDGALFHDSLVSLSQSHANIWGSFPSYHNYWAALFIFFALTPGVKARWRYPMLALGALISLSTLTLHQHCVLDVVLTYAMTALFLALTRWFHWDDKLLAWFER
ncbi:MAG: phosphatase PAP2 family protein [Bifidobacteriaceae bacterium]|nr:phosphatase PAP2 family protein [Bifidobacteriaceae bacterium]